MNALLQVGPMPQEGSFSVIVTISGLEMAMNLRRDTVLDLIDVRLQAARATIIHELAKHGHPGLAGEK